MKIRNMRDMREAGDYVYAEVDCIEQSWLFWESTKTVTVFRHRMSAFWRFLDTGRFTPGSQLENLADAAAARKALEDSLSKNA